MTIERMIELLEIEHECMLRGAHDACDRKCADCELVQEDDELHEMYTNVVWLLKEQEEQIKNRDESLEKAREEIKWLRRMLKEQEVVPVYEDKNNKCECGETVCRYWHPKFCGFCGKELLWY